MKPTTYVRVVLPSDELVRMKCIASMTVADLMKTLKKRCSMHIAMSVDSLGNKTGESNNSENDPTVESTTCYRLEGNAPESIQGKLILVRTEMELNAQALVTNEVKELDILEFKIDSLRSLEPTLSRGIMSSHKIAPIKFPYPQVVKKTEQPLLPTLIKICQKRDEKAMRIKSKMSTIFLARAEVNRDLEVRKKYSIQLSNVAQALFRKRARQHATTQEKRLRLLAARFRKAQKDAKCTERILLRAGFQLIERIRLVQENVRRLVCLLRDAVLGNNLVGMCDLLSIAKAMVKALAHTKVDTNLVPSSILQDDNENLVRRLSRNIAGKDGGITVVLQGWVVSAEWGTFWRSQRREYACLCDNYMLYFFSSRMQCSDYVFELGRERNGSASETSKRLLKHNSPLSQVDLSETDWTVRKTFQDESHGALHRNAFAFFDLEGRIRLILDVNSSAEATKWARVIAGEISRYKLIARMRELNEELARKDLEEEEHINNANRLSAWTEILTQSSAVMNDNHALIIPLCSLYSQIDRQSKTARAERYKSWTLGQALKDLQRDCVKVNGLVLAGKSLEANVSTLTLELLKCSEAGRQSEFKARHSKISMPLNEAEMVALRFAQQVIIFSSRTHGGGDIFDSLHLLFDSQRYCVCPETESIEPIEIIVSQKVDTLHANITMKMTYRVFLKNCIGPKDNGAEMLVPKFDCSSENVKRKQTAEFKIVGTHSQQVSCNFIEANNVEGSIQLQVAKETFVNT